jgi:Putative Ig domain/IPT/TIG domain/FG-GAP-like repeat
MPPTLLPTSLRATRIKRQINTVIRSITVMLLTLFVIPHEAAATTVTAAWNTNAEPDIAGYVLKYGTQSGTYTTSVDVGNVTSRVLDLSPGLRYYFVVQAYNTSGLFSPNSSPEVFLDVPASTAPAISVLSPAAGPAGTMVTVSGTNFGATQGASVIRFNGVTGTPSSWSATSIVVPVPAGATTGPVVVTVGGVASNGPVFSVNRPPTLNVVADQTSAENSDVSLALVGSDPDGSAVTYSATNLPGGLSLNATTGVIAGRLTFSSAGSYTVTATVSDGTLSASRTFAWTVTNVNAPPVLTNPGSQTNVAATTVSLSLTATDPDGTALTYSATGLPPGLTVNSASGVIAGTLTSATGTYSVTATATDGSLSASQSFTWTVTAPAPITLVQHVSVDAGTKTTASQAFPSNNTSGNFIAVVVRAGGVGLALTVTDTRGNTYRQAAQFTNNADNTVGVYYAENIAGGANTVTVALPSSATLRVSLLEYSGIATANSLDGAVWATGAGVSPTSGSLTTTSSGDLLLGVVSTVTNANVAAGAGFTIKESVPALPNAKVISEDQVQTSAGNAAATATLSVSDQWGATLAAFKPLAGGGSAAPAITTLAPASGAAGTSVTVSGTNFGATQGASVIRFNGVTGTPSSWSATSIVVPVPGGATTGPVVVTVGGVASSGVTFTVSSSGALPTPWLDQNVGSPALTGPATFAAGTFSVTAGGIDIWDKSDQFHFVYQSLAGDGEIVARVASLQNTDPWTKAGVMIRESLTANARNAFMLVSAANGMRFQQRATAGGVTTSAAAGAGAAPQWLRLVRSGNRLTGYTSPDGSTWTAQSSATLTLPTQAYIGLAVTSHNSGLTANATFSNVTVIGPAGSVTTMAAPANQISAVTASPADTASSSRLAAVNVRSGSRMSSMDYDGDRRADIAVYRPSTGEWHVLTSHTNYAQGFSVIWGTSTDVPVPGDFDGDGRTDPAYYRPSTGTWSILKSSSNYTTSFDVVLGADGDIPVPGDYDGDGITDVGVYSPQTGQWHVLKSSSGYTTEIVTVLGGRGSRPVPGDYDGDGRTDPAVYDSVTGQWRILSSSTDYATSLSVVVGTPGDIPAPEDYDGDAITDLAVFNPGTGAWRILLSSANFTDGVVLTVGGATGTPVPGDYDGDGKADLALFGSGSWRIWLSSLKDASGLTLSSGPQTDIPLPNLPSP